MSQSVFRAGHYFEIFDAVIEPVVIDVVDLLPRLKPSAKVLLYDPSVFEHSRPVRQKLLPVPGLKLPLGD